MRTQFGQEVLHCRGAGADGAPAVPHGSRVKVRLEHPGGFSVDRIPAWIRWATQEKELGAHYNGVYWAPPADQQYKWCDYGSKKAVLI